ncbi:S8 family serine peptidase [Aestuariivirga sp.]|uniref:S8 family serine peptidase n=1 Tax=Aestuariivirga sp. TaxID=2650926 RepID=UPI0035944D68
MERKTGPGGFLCGLSVALGRICRAAGFGLVVGALALTPGTWVASAWADDDGDDGGGGGRGRGGGQRSERSERSERNERKTFETKKKKAVQQRKKKVAAKPAPRPVVVALDLPEAGLTEATRRGFTVLSDDTLQSVGVRVQRLRLPRNMSVATARNVLASLGAAESDVNSIYRPQEEDECAPSTPCSPLVLVDWPVNAELPCAASPVIGLVETTVNTKDASLAGQSVEVIDLRPKGTARSGNAHGTAVAALVAGSRGSNAEGLLPQARVIAAVPYYRSSGGNDVAQAFDVVRAVDALLRESPHVVNLSLAGPANAVIERVIKLTVAKGVPVVAAAGNAGSGSKPLYPAAYEDAVAVTAVSPTLRIYRRAPRGEHIDFAAPGVEVPVATGTGRVASRSGTSYAAPYVTAALAVMRLRSPDAPIADLVAELARTARDLGEPGKDKVFGWGLLQADGICGNSG